MIEPARVLFEDHRSGEVARSRGRAPELGVGGSLNLAFYDPARVESLIGIDPPKNFRRQANTAPRALSLKVDILAGEVEALETTVTHLKRARAAASNRWWGSELTWRGMPSHLNSMDQPPSSRKTNDEDGSKELARGRR